MPPVSKRGRARERRERKRERASERERERERERESRARKGEVLREEGDGVAVSDDVVHRAARRARVAQEGNGNGRCPPHNSRGLVSAMACFSAATEARGLVSAMLCFSYQSVN